LGFFTPSPYIGPTPIQKTLGNLLGALQGYGPWAMTKTAKALGEKQNMIYELFMVIY
jgi:hypothetical protein